MLGVTGGMAFALGMCMCLIAEWGTFVPGVIVSVVGAIILCAAYLNKRRMDGDTLTVSGKSMLNGFVGILGVALLGIGVVLCTQQTDKMLLGIVIGSVGILVLFALIPLVGGLKD